MNFANRNDSFNTRPNVVVIGAGPGGYVCAIRLAQRGKNVVLVEKHQLGGECLNYGCIPSKALIFASSLYDKLTKSSQFGIEIEGAKFNPQKLQEWRQNLVKKLNQGIGFLLKQNKVEVVQGEASFMSAHKVSIKKSDGSHEEIEAEKFVIATGSRTAKIPGFEFDDNLVISSQKALELADIPSTLLVLGGGVIGLELGMYFSKLGSQVTIVELLPQLLNEVDPELVSVLERSLKKRNITIMKNTKAVRMEMTPRVKLIVETGGAQQELMGDKLLVTVGRLANTESLNLKNAGVLADNKGFIKVNTNLETNAPNIYAIGDVIGAPLLAHKASFQGIQVADSITHGESVKKRPIAHAIFTDPEIAGVGLTQLQAEAQGFEVKVGKFPFMALGRAVSVGDVEGFTKIIADKKTDVVLGVFIVGAHASDLISEGALAVTHQLKLKDIAGTIHPHPTLSESIMEASEAALGEAIHISNK